MSKKKLSKLLALYLLCGNWLAGNQSGEAWRWLWARNWEIKSYR